MLRYTANLSVLFTELPLIERFAAARAAGFRAVEIQFPYELSVGEIATALDTHDLSLVLINIPAGDLMTGGDGLGGVPGREAEFRRAVAQAMPYAHQLGVRAVNLLAGRQPEDQALLPCLMTLKENARLAAEAFDEIGVQVTLEAINTIDMPRFLIHSVAQMQEMLEAVDHPNLKMQFDAYHLAMMGDDVVQSFRRNWSQVGHVQFADRPGRGAPGTGGIDFSRFFAALRQLPYAGWCGAEYHPGPVGTLASLDWLRRHPES